MRYPFRKSYRNSQMSVLGHDPKKGPRLKIDVVFRSVFLLDLFVCQKCIWVEVELG